MRVEPSSDRAARIVSLAVEAGVSIATAESVTGGLVCDALVAVPGASSVVKGGIVAYDVDVKRTVLGVAGSLLADEGPVSPSVASAMARGAMRHLSATVAVATTGVAGPEPHGGHPPGTIVVAVVTPWGDSAITVRRAGDREEVRRAAVDAALSELERMLLQAPDMSR